jgi:tetratricopeptide (TPR) repeat protein
MTRTQKSRGRGSGGRRTGKKSAKKGKSLKKKVFAKPVTRHIGPVELSTPAVEQQLKQFDAAVALFQQQKFQKARQEFERVAAGPGKELADRARLHLKMCDQRLAAAAAAPRPRSADEHYHQGVAMMNQRRWDEAREHLEKARKLAPKADHIIYAMAALDCLTGEADAALENLKLAIQLRPENRYHARNDEDFSFLQEDPRFTELLYPEREIPA